MMTHRTRQSEPRNLLVSILFCLAGMTLLACSISCASSGITKGMQAGVVASAALDLHSTTQAIERGGIEANPFLGQSLEQQVLVKSASLTGVFWLTSRIERKSPVLARAVLFGITSVQLWAANHNRGVGR